MNKSSSYPAFIVSVITLATVPLALAPGLQFPEITPKLLVVSAGAGLIWIALGLSNAFPALGKEHKLYFLLLAAMAGWSILATVFSRDPVLSLAGSEARRLGLPAWIACIAIAAALPVILADDARRKRILLAALVIASLLISGYAFLQYLGIDPWIDTQIYHITAGPYHAVRPPSTLGHADWFGMFSLVVLFAAAGLALSGTKQRERLLWAGATLVQAIAVVISGSRAAWMGGACGVAILAFYTGRRRELFAGVIGIAVVAIALVLSPLGSRVRSRVRIFATDRGVLARVYVWRDSLRLIANHPLLGTGPETFPIAFPQFESTELAQYAPDNYVESPHNVFLDYIADAGLPAGIGFIALIIIAWKRYSASSRTDPLDAALLAALLAGVVAMQFIGDTISTRLALLAVIALSFSAPKAFSPIPVRVAVISAAAIGLAIVMLYGGRLVYADRALYEARQAANRRDVPMALQAGASARRAFPWTGAHAFAFSRMVAQLALVPDVVPEERKQLLRVAQDSAAEGLLHSSQPASVYVHLSSLLVLQGKRKEGESALESAERTAPVWYRPRWLSAVLLAGDGQFRLAGDEADAAMELGAGDHPEIAESCQKIRQLASENARPEPIGMEGRPGEELRLTYEQAVVHPREKRSDTLNQHWAFSYHGNSLVTLPPSDLLWVIDVPPGARFHSLVRMSFSGTNLAFAIVRINAQEVFSKLMEHQEEVDVDLRRFAGKRIELQLAATPTPAGDKGSWVQWVEPRISVDETGQ